MLKVTKRNRNLVPFDINRIETAISKAFRSCGIVWQDEVVKDIARNVKIWEGISVEDIQDQVEELLMDYDYPQVAKEYILYRAKHKETRFIRDRINYMDRYSKSSDNAATSSETDANANVTMKNVANLEGEVYKSNNRIIQRQMMKDELHKLFPEIAKQYEEDLEHHIIYTHDEASTPVLKQYCMAVSLYPLMVEGVGNIDGVTPSEPNDLQSFSGQITNLAFLLSSQCKGAVAFGEYFIALNYYIIKEYGPNWYDKLDCSATSPHSLIHRTVKDCILKAFKQFVWGINQPAGNRSYQSPFTNISYYDKTYFTSLFGEFYYPDGSKPEWKAIDTLQRLFLKWFNNLRLKQVLTFPVETFAMVHDGNDIIDKDYKDLCAEMYAEGHSFFTYISDSADSLASCCRLRNELAENTFNPTSGLTGVMTGSCNVITLNINRIVQDWARWYCCENPSRISNEELISDNWRSYLNENIVNFKKYLIKILERVYKYHIAYKTMLYDIEDAGVLTSSKAGYIYMKKLYSTIGLNGINEAAEFLGIECSYNEDYKNFCRFITGTIKEQNKLHNIHDKKRPFLFNQEFVPAESLGAKNYNWDKEDGYIVNPDRVLYNSYFYLAHDNTSVLDKFRLHGKEFTETLDGGVGCHINLEEHLSKEQYLKLIEFAVENGTSYFTLNIPNSECEDCHYIVKKPITECPKCHSKKIKWYTRIIGYLRAIKNFGYERQIEASKRTYSKGIE